MAKKANPKTANRSIDAAIMRRMLMALATAPYTPIKLDDFAASVFRLLEVRAKRNLSAWKVFVFNYVAAKVAAGTIPKTWMDENAPKHK